MKGIIFLYIFCSFISYKTYAVTALTQHSGNCGYVDGTNGVFSETGSVCDITSDGVCRKVNNSSGLDYFVPGKEGSGNFATFYTTPPAGVTILACVRATTTTPTTTTTATGCQPNGTVCTTTPPDTPHARPACTSCCNSSAGQRFRCDLENYERCGTGDANCAAHGGFCTGSCTDL